MDRLIFPIGTFLSFLKGIGFGINDDRGEELNKRESRV